MAQDYNFKGNVDISAIAGLIQRKNVQEFEMQEAIKARRLRELQAIVDIGGKLASGAVQASKFRQQREFADALAATKMTPGHETTTDVPDQYAQAPEEQAVPTPSHAFGNGVGPTTNVVEGVPQEDGTVAPQNPVAIPAHQETTYTPPQDNPTSIAIRKGAMVDPEEAAQQFMEQQFPNQTQQMGMYGSGQRVFNIKTGERGAAQFGKDGSIRIDGVPISPEEFKDWDFEYAPQGVETTGGVFMAPKVPGATYGTAGSAPEKGQTKQKFTDYDVREQAHLNKVKASLEGDTVYEKLNMRDAELQQAIASVDTGNWVGDATIPSLLAKGLGRDAGALSDQDQRRYNVSPEVWRRIKTKYSRWMEGTLTQEDREDIREAIRVAREKNKSLMKDRRGIFERKAVSGLRKGYDEEFVRGYLTGLDDDAGAAPEGAGGIDGIAQLLNLPRKK